jgi:MSHA biogenesis protein MshN
MSVVNQMLLDLDRRRASALERHELPGNVRPALPLRSYRPLVLAGVVAATATAAIAGAALFHAPAATPDPAGLVAPVAAARPVPEPAGKETTVEAEDPPPATLSAASAARAVKMTPDDKLRMPGREAERTATPATSQRIGASAPETSLKATMTLAARVREPATEPAQSDAGEQSTLDKRLAVESLPDPLQQATGGARRQLEQGDVAGALATLQAFAQAGAASAEYRGLLAAVLQRAGRHAEAIAEYRAALRMLPAMSVWWLGLALSLEAEGRRAESREALQHARAGGGLSAELAAYVDEKLRYPD